MGSQGDCRRGFGLLLVVLGGWRQPEQSIFDTSATTSSALIQTGLYLARTLLITTVQYRKHKDQDQIKKLEGAGHVWRQYHDQIADSGLRCGHEQISKMEGTKAHGGIYCLKACSYSRPKAESTRPVQTRSDVAETNHQNGLKQAALCPREWDRTTRIEPLSVQRLGESGLLLLASSLSLFPARHEPRLVY
jgi:hypothetical protein